MEISLEYLGTHHMIDGNYLESMGIFSKCKLKRQGGPKGTSHLHEHYLFLQKHEPVRRQ